MSEAHRSAASHLQSPRVLSSTETTADATGWFEHLVRGAGSLDRQIALLHRWTAHIARAHRRSARPEVWTLENHEHQIGAAVARVRSKPGLDRPTDDLLDRLLEASFGLVGSSIPIVSATTIDPSLQLFDEARGSDVVGLDELPLLALDDLVRSWLAIVAPAPSANTRSWHAGRWAPNTSPVHRSELAAASIVDTYVRTVGLDRAFVPVLAVYAALQRFGHSTSGAQPDDCDADLRHFVDLGEELFDDLATFEHPPKRRRIGVIAPFPLADAGHGAPAAVRGTIAALSHRHDVEAVCTVEQSSSDVVESSSLRVLEVERPANKKTWRKAMLVVGMLRGRAPWATEWKSPAFAAAVGSVVRRSDITHVELVVLTDSLPADGSRPSRTIIVDHDPPITSSMLQLGRDPWWFRPYRLLEVQAWARTHRRAGKRAAVIVVFGAADKRIVERFIRTTPIVIAPIEIDIPTRALNPAGTAPHTLAFVGSYRRTPNIDSVERLVGRIMPMIWQERSDVRLLIVGAEPPPCATSSDPRIVATGFVDDLSEVLDDVAVLVAPISLGHGMRVKVFEALAWGKAVVTTSQGAAGFPDSARRCMVVVDDDADFATAVVRLLGDESRRVELASAGREWAKGWLDIDRSADRLDDLHDLVDAITAHRHP